MSEPSSSPEGAEAAVVERLRDAGRFISVGRLIRDGRVKSLADAVDGRMAIKTFRALAESFAQIYGFAGLPLYESDRGPKNDQARSWVRLTPAGHAVLARLESGAAAFFPDSPPAPATRARVIVEDLAMFDGVVDRIAEAVPAADVVRWQRGQVEEMLTSSPAKHPAIALLWGSSRGEWARGVVAETLSPAVPLGVLCRKHDRLIRPAKGVLPNRTLALREVDAAVTVAYAGSLFDPRRLLPPKASARDKASLVEVLVDAVSGACDYAIVPDVPDVLDPLRASGAVSFMRLAPVEAASTSVSLTALTVHGRGHPDHATVRAVAEAAAVAFAQGSTLDLPARDRELPADPAAYSRPLRGWFLDSALERPVWRPETLQFEDVRRVAPSDGTAADDTRPRPGSFAPPEGQHSLRLRGWLENHRQERFALSGGLISTHSLYFVADSVGPVGGGTNPAPATFVAVFPYSREYEGKRVWVGFYIGRDPLHNPLTVPMVLADGPLEDSDLDALARGVLIRPLWVPQRRPKADTAGVGGPAARR